MWQADLYCCHMAINELSGRVARTIRRTLDAKQMTQESLVESTGIPMRTMARRLHVTNPSPMSLEELAIIADALGVSMGALLAAEEPMAVAS